jgi:hypothetical protein
MTPAPTTSSNLLVEPDTNPMDVYEHPYAHAAWRGIDYQTADLRHAA